MATEYSEKVLQAADILAGKTFAVLTGAGISTDSGIPDYRSPESPKRKPMTIDKFKESENYYRRYWMGSFYGYTHMQDVKPNPGHYALADMEKHRFVNGILTQNVDPLHERAGSKNVVHLHGNLSRVRCLRHGHVFKRSDITDMIRHNNPTLHLDDVEINPDGDADIQLVEEFRAPMCPTCGSRIKPDVIYFGELMLEETVAAASKIIDKAEGLLVAGSSLMVNSGFRFFHRIVAAGKPTVIVNRGPVKGQDLATLKINEGLSENLPKIAALLAEQKVTH